VIEIRFLLHRKKKRKREKEQVNSTTTINDAKDDGSKENWEKK
jgi:hypothetical protein